MKRGEIWWITNDGQLGCEQRGIRPALIVSNDLCNTHSPVIQMVPLTCARKKPMPTHVVFTLDGRRSTIMCEQICAVDKGRIQKFKGKISPDTMRLVERAMRIQLGMEGV